MSGTQPQALGAELARAREALGLSVDEVSRRTRVRPELVREMEAGRFKALGAPVYARGHLRTVASALGLDAAALVAEFDRTHGAPGPSTTRARVDPHARAADRRPLGWVPVVVAALLVVVGLGLVGLLVDDEPADPAQDTSVAQEAGAADDPGGPTEDPAEPAPVPAPPEAPDDTAPDGPLAAVDEVVLVLSTPERPSWVRVSDAAGQVLFEGTLEQGAEQEFRAPDLLSVVLGDAGAVRLQVNGEDRGPAGGPGQVARLELGPPQVAG